MMFSYVIYGPLMLITALACYKGGGERRVFDYLINLLLVNILCDIGFILFPVASPVHFNPNLYHTSLNGGFFTWCGEWVRTNLHHPGESLPSAHCAVTIVMLMVSFRYNRKFFLLTLPTLIMVFPATVYCRYHYTIDVLAGIAVGVLTVYFSPIFVAVSAKMMDLVTGEVKRKISGVHLNVIETEG